MSTNQRVSSRLTREITTLMINMHLYVGYSHGNKPVSLQKKEKLRLMHRVAKRIVNNLNYTVKSLRMQKSPG